jgi:hypothetical protein
VCHSAPARQSDDQQTQAAKQNTFHGEVTSRTDGASLWFVVQGNTQRCKQASAVSLLSPRVVESRFGIVYISQVKLFTYQSAGLKESDPKQAYSRGWERAMAAFPIYLPDSHQAPDLHLLRKALATQMLRYRSPPEDDAP